MTLGSRLIQPFLFNLPCSCLFGINKRLTFKSMALDWSCDWLDPRLGTSLLSRTCSYQPAVPLEADLVLLSSPRSLAQFLYELPTRMNLEDCEVDTVSMNDLWNEIRHISSETKAQFISMDCYQLLSCLLMLLKIITVMASTFARAKTLLEEAE